MRGGQIRKILSQIPEKENLAILDFEWNDRANIWIDHHFEPDLGPDPVKNDRMFYDPSAKSTVQLISEKYGCQDGQKELVSMVNMIDSASYPDTEFIFRSDHPLMILRAYLEVAYPSSMMYCRIVEMIASYSCDVAKAIKRMCIDYSTVRNIYGMARKIEKEMIVFGKCSCVNQTRQNQYPRYSEFFINPDIHYAIRISISGPHQKYIQVGYNQWCGVTNKLNIGEFMRSLHYVRGGGHFSVGAGVIKNEDEQRFLDDADIYFNKEEAMEKYAVDKKDPVESRAQELVKTGVDLNDAREQSQKEMEKGSDDSSEGELRSSDDIRKAD